MKYLIIALLFFACASNGINDCTLINATIVQKRSYRVPSRGVSNTHYYLIAIDDNSHMYKLNCTEVKYQFTIVGSEVLVAKCKIEEK